MEPDGLAVGTAGNLSVRCGERVLITPGGVAYDALEEDAVAEVAGDGAHVDGPRPSSELPMHLAAYAVEGVEAVVHTHARYATAVACVADELPPIHYLLASLGESVPVVPYARFGSDELAGHVREWLPGRRAVLLGHHGTVTVGASLAEAYDAARTLEWLAALWVTAAGVGDPRPLPREEIAAVAAKMRGLGYLPS
jgi:L-fuculose-phosphate aldolase